MRPSDWSPVGLDADPTPGDPVLVLSGGQEYLEVAGSIDSAASSMSRLDVDGTVSQAVDALMATKEDTIGEIRKAHGRYVAAGEALVGFASSLERVQSETLAALDKARDAQDQVQAASGSKDRWQDLADGAKDESEKREYEQKAEQAGGDADQAVGIISSAKSTVESAVSDRDRAAEHAIDRIEEITSSDDLNDGWWDNWGSKLVAAIADIADMISTIAGILAIIVAFIPVVGTALAGVLIVIAAVAAIVSAVANITLAATGERSWAEAGLAIAGAALSLIGLGAAAKAATGLAKGISKGAVKQGMKNGWCKFGFGKCFVAGTLIHTPDGQRPIEDITVGDKVWARDLETGRDELQVVTETFVRTTAEMFHLTINGERVSTTAEHPFMVHGRGWLDAAFLKVGDLLVTPEGTTVPVEAIETEARDEADAETVYNFHVETHSNYYVYAGDTPVLVHNSGHIDDALGDLAGQRVTTGRVFDSNGNRLRDDLTSGLKDDPLADAAQARLQELRPMNGPYNVAGDVETKLAVWMRDSGVTNADVAINNPKGVCEGMFSCTNAVPAILPEGSAMNVWFPGAAEPTVLNGRAVY